jgi:hypothetical protein
LANFSLVRRVQGRIGIFEQLDPSEGSITLTSGNEPSDGILIVTVASAAHEISAETPVAVVSELPRKSDEM